ncbi:MAG TPA: peptidyl-prolyl cis-trans isomerase, partial [Myxococcaceae bacterium]|nr:peptidyl-prolyl cis-trans isomerase [Myxococcaceae bacterium]
MIDLLLRRQGSLALVLALAACSRSSDKVTIDLRRGSQGTPVATYAGGFLSVEEVNRALAQMPPMVRMRYQTPAQKKELVERLVRLDLLAREAAARGHANDPEVVEAFKNILAQRTVKDELDSKSAAPTDAEVQAYYDAHPADYARPETYRVSTLFLAAPENDAARRKTQGMRAQQLLAQARRLKPDDFAGFGQLVKANSEDPSKMMEGDLRALTIADLTNRYGPEVARAVQDLQNPGDLSGVVQTKTGFHILKLRAHTPASQAPLAEVKAQITTRLQNEKRNQAYEKFLADLKTRANVQIDEAALAKVVVEGPPRGGEPGPMPPRAMMPAPGSAPL